MPTLPRSPGPSPQLIRASRQTRIRDSTPVSDSSYPVCRDRPEAGKELDTYIDGEGNQANKLLDARTQAVRQDHGASALGPSLEYCASAQHDVARQPCSQIDADAKLQSALATADHPLQWTPSVHGMAHFTGQTPSLFSPPIPQRSAHPHLISNSNLGTIQKTHLENVGNTNIQYHIYHHYHYPEQSSSRWRSSEYPQEPNHVEAFGKPLSATNQVGTDQTIRESSVRSSRVAVHASKKFLGFKGAYKSVVALCRKIFVRQAKAGNPPQSKDGQQSNFVQPFPRNNGQPFNSSLQSVPARPHPSAPVSRPEHTQASQPTKSDAYATAMSRDVLSPSNVEARPPGRRSPARPEPALSGYTKPCDWRNSAGEQPSRQGHNIQSPPVVTTPHEQVSPALAKFISPRFLDHRLPGCADNESGPRYTREEKGKIPIRGWSPLSEDGYDADEDESE